MLEPALPRWPPVARQSVNESFDCLEHWLLSTRKEPMIIAVELNELSASDLAGHIATCRNTHGPVVPAVQHQRGHRNPWQEVSHVGVAQRLEHGPNPAGTSTRNHKSLRRRPLTRRWWTFDLVHTNGSASSL